MNAKINKVILDMQKVECKINELQSKWQKLNEQKTELENLEIVGLIRGANISSENLSDVLKAYHSKSDVPFSIQKQEENNNEKN